MSIMTDMETRAYALALGEAAIEAWADFPQDVQRTLFERAVNHRNLNDTSLRERLAMFLHDRHPRTDAHPHAG